MPLPKPKKDESKDNFLPRCISELKDMKEFNSHDQRVAVCYSQWKRSNESMEILDRIDKVLNETGIRRIKDLSKEYKTAEIYFHKDLDGVTSAIGMKTYLKNYGIKVVDAHPIQYGGEEYAVPKPKDKTLAVMVDFAHGKPVMHIHTDHHEGQVGFSKTASTSFVKTPSNAAFISQTLSPKDLFPPQDTKIISTVDSADFASQGLTPDDIMRATFKVDKEINVSKNHRAMGLVVNKLTLAYKNKDGFLKRLVMEAKPSLMSMFNVLKKLAKEAGYKPPEEVESGTKEYADVQKSKIKRNVNIKSLKSGEQTIVGTTIFQYGGGSMFKGYDRYTPFKNNPEADYLCIAWPMGLLQLSKNPFKGAINPYHLGDIANKVLKKFKSKLKNIEVTLNYLKQTFERDIQKKKIKNAMGFTFDDLIALYEKDLKGLVGSRRWKDMIKDITNKPYSRLSPKQKDVMKKVSINLWDLITSQSGGHKDITNISGFNFAGKGFTDILRDVQAAFAKEMKNKSLEEKER
jgi:hypothetical protein